MYTTSNATYARTYITDIFQKTEIHPPDPTLAGEFIENLRILHSSRLKGGDEAVRQAWTQLIEFHPELNQLLRPPDRPKILLARELKDFPPIEWFIPGMLAKRSLCEVHGAPGSGKSLFTLRIAFYLAQKYRVLYLGAEGASGYSARIRALEECSNEIVSDNFRFYLNSVNLLDDKAVAEFITELEPFQPDLIIIDTLARCMIGGDENSKKDMGLVTDACDRIRHKLNATILLVHHTGKTGTSERGSSGLRADCDSMIELTNHDDVITVSSSKLKDGKPFETQQFIMAEYGESVALVPTNKISKQSTKAPMLKSNDLKVLEMLNMEIYIEPGATNRRISDNTGITGGTLDRVLSRLKKEGYISLSKKGDPYLITAKGKAVLAA